jgi:hypothetical protein
VRKQRANRAAKEESETRRSAETTTALIEEDCVVFKRTDFEDMMETVTGVYEFIEEAIEQLRVGGKYSSRTREYVEAGSKVVENAMNAAREETIKALKKIVKRGKGRVKRPGGWKSPSKPPPPQGRDSKR